MARARKHLAKGDAVKALHLLDIVLGAEQGHQAALETAQQAHHLLLQDTDNFWLASWLRNQGKQLGTRLQQIEG